MLLQIKVAVVTLKRGEINGRKNIVPCIYPERSLNLGPFQHSKDKALFDLVSKFIISCHKLPLYASSLGPLYFFLHPLVAVLF